jgi:L-serine dehydratase
MENSLTVINSSQSTCGSCNASGSGTCEPAPSVAPASLSRREFGYAALLASDRILLAGCSKEPAPQQAAQSAPAATTTSGPAPTLSPDLEVVKESTLPIMTTLEEFYKIGPGPSSSHTMGPMRITYDFSQRHRDQGS